ncbi:MAG: DUF6036 family nucleotidyltransferase [Myxococcota bacterium]
MSDGRQLDAEAWKEVLSRLGDEIGSPPIEVFVIGGAAMALTFHERRTTQDVDVVSNSDEDRDRILAAGERIRSEFGLPEDWINEKAKEAGFLVADAFANLDRFKTFSFGNLTLVVPSLLHMTAMKLAALRTQTDRDDVVILLKQLRTRGMDRDAVLAHVGGLMPVAKQESARYDLEDLWEYMDEST